MTMPNSDKDNQSIECEWKINWMGGIEDIALIAAAAYTGWWLLIVLCFLTGGPYYCTKHKNHESLEHCRNSSGLISSLAPKQEEQP
jgi:hypothetical protein